MVAEFKSARRSNSNVNISGQQRFRQKVFSDIIAITNVQFVLMQKVQYDKNHTAAVH